MRRVEALQLRLGAQQVECPGLMTLPALEAHRETSGGGVTAAKWGKGGFEVMLAQS